MRTEASSVGDLFARETRRVKVLLPLPLAGAYDYRVPEDLDVAAGDFVTVPLGNRKVTGVVWGDSDDDGVAESRLKDVEARLTCLPLPAANREFVDWMAAYCLSPPGAVLRMAMSAPAALEPPKSILLYERSSALPDGLKITKARSRVLALLEDGPARTSAELVQEAGVSSGVVKGLADAGALNIIKAPAGGRWRRPDPDTPGPSLSGDQRDAAQRLVEQVREDAFSVSLLDGVTGSGKTEVYFEAICECLRQGRQVLVMLPEIALSAQWLERFQKRFGTPPAEWHSDLTSAKRRDTWRAVAEGKIRILVGARSALHLPFPELGLIVIDEEHDGAFKQEDGVIYHARDMAVVRARIANCPLVLASATPSLETVNNAEQGRYERLHLSERHGGAKLPEISIVDIRKNAPPRQRWITPPLEKALKETLEAGEQAMLFLNRRGYAPLTLCRSCGHRMQCPNCSTWLVEHRFSRRLECHHCGHQAVMPETCPECDAEESFVACGPGVERLAEEAINLFPEASMEIVTSDTLAGPAAAAAFVDRVVRGESNLIIGTQIVAKGYHFPLLTLVGVVDADLGLSGGDLRASERTYQLLHQVAGRAGREGRPGRVMIQTANPDAPVIEALASGDRDGFLEAESMEREIGGWPPHGRLAALIVSGMEESVVDDVADALGRTAPQGDGVRTLGPTPAPLALLRGRHRRRLLLKCGREHSIQKVLKTWLSPFKFPSSIRVAIDIDPHSFM